MLSPRAGMHQHLQTPAHSAGGYPRRSAAPRHLEAAWKPPPSRLESFDLGEMRGEAKASASAWHHLALNFRLWRPLDLPHLRHSPSLTLAVLYYGAILGCKDSQHAYSTRIQDASHSGRDRASDLRCRYGPAYPKWNRNTASTLHCPWNRSSVEQATGSSRSVLPQTAGEPFNDATESWGPWRQPSRSGQTGNCYGRPRIT